MLLSEGAGKRDRGHGAGQRERREHDHLIAPRHLDDPLQHRRVEPERRGRVDDREQRRLALKRLVVDAAGDLHHLDRVQIALAPEAIGVDRLVGQGQHVEQRVEMADGGVNVDRLDRIAAPEMDRIEALAEADEVLEVAFVSLPPPARAVERIGRARHRSERDVSPADHEIAGRVARVQREFLRRQPDVGFDQRRIEPNPPRGRIDVGAGVAQHRARLVMQEVDADLLQDRERGLMDRFELVAGDEVERRERRLRLAGRRRRGSSAALDRAPASGAAPVSCGGESVVIHVPQSLAARGRA